MNAEATASGHNIIAVFSNAHKSIKILGWSVHDVAIG
jgi:hypothetical protein